MNNSLYTILTSLCVMGSVGSFDFKDMHMNKMSTECGYSQCEEGRHKKHKNFDPEEKAQKLIVKLNKMEWALNLIKKPVVTDSDWFFTKTEEVYKILSLAKPSHKKSPISYLTMGLREVCNFNMLFIDKSPQSVYNAMQNLLLAVKHLTMKSLFMLGGIMHSHDKVAKAELMRAMKAIDKSVRIIERYIVKHLKHLKSLKKHHHHAHHPVSLMDCCDENRKHICY